VKNEVKIFRLNSRPEGSEPHQDHHTRLVEYDGWMREEEKKYSQLLAELNKSQRLTQSHIDKLRNNEYASQNIMEEEMLLDSEETRLTSDELRHGCGLTMEDVLIGRERLASDADECQDRNITQNSMNFQSTISLRRKNISTCSESGSKKEWKEVVYTLNSEKRNRDGE
jgi:hypothetical protein